MARTTHGYDHDFAVGDRGFNYYDMKWGTVEQEPSDDGWFKVRHDDGSTAILNDERFVTPAVAKRYNYGTDPKS
jgi:hypothetical protein